MCIKFAILNTNFKLKYGNEIKSIFLIVIEQKKIFAIRKSC